MRKLKRLGALVAAVFALSAIASASASAAEFTASGTGELSGEVLNIQVFTTNGGKVECTGLDVLGKIVSTATTELHLTETYTGCTAFGGFAAEITPATYLLTANGEVHIKNTIEIKVPLAKCNVTIGPQTVSAVGYANNSGKLRVVSNISNIAYTSSGGICGSSGSNGTFTGNTNLLLIGGGGVLGFDP